MSVIDRFIYLGGPITGLTFDEAKNWRDEIVLPEGWVGLSPMRDKEHFRVSGPLPSTFDAGSDAVAQDLSDIRVMDVGLWNFLGAERASVGSAAEIGYAFALGKPIVVVQEPIAHHAVQANPHDHIFIHELATVEFTTLDDALAWLVDFSVVNHEVDQMLRENTSVRPY